MFDPTKNKEMALETPMSRFVKDGRPRLWPVIDRPLRMCLVISNPPGLEKSGLKPVDVPVEKNVVSDALADVLSLVRLGIVAPAPTVDELKATLAEIRPHIVYVLAHAIYDQDNNGKLLFSSGDSVPRELPFPEFVSLVAPPGVEAPYLLILALPLDTRVDSPNTIAPLGQLLVAAGVQAVVAVHAPLPKSELLKFTESFFDNLLHTGIVDAAVMTARQQIYRPGSWEWTFPVLYLRAPDAVLFETFDGDLSSVAR